jgi:hypothetical protein
LLFYKATTAGNKGGIEPAKGDGAVDRRQCLRSAGKQIVHVDPHALAGLRLLSRTKCLPERDWHWMSAQIDRRSLRYLTEEENCRPPPFQVARTATTRR